MWPGEQPPGGGQSPQQPWTGQQSNPYQQTGYHQPNPHQQSQPWHAPAQPVGAPTPPPSGGGRNRNALVAIVAAAAVVVASAVTGFALLGGGKDDTADPEPAKSGSPQAGSSDPRGTGTDQATIKGWKVVVNPREGIAFDVPPQWAVKSTTWVTYVSENDDPDDKVLIGVRAPAFLQEQWCASDDDKDGTDEYAPLGAAGSKGNNGAKSTDPDLGVRAGYLLTPKGTWSPGRSSAPRAYPGRYRMRPCGRSPPRYGSTRTRRLLNSPVPVRV